MPSRKKKRRTPPYTLNNRYLSVLTFRRPNITNKKVVPCKFIFLHRPSNQTARGAYSIHGTPFTPLTKTGQSFDNNPPFLESPAEVAKRSATWRYRIPRPPLPQNGHFSTPPPAPLTKSGHLIYTKIKLSRSALYYIDYVSRQPSKHQMISTKSTQKTHPP